MTEENEEAKENGWVHNLGRNTFGEAASLLPDFVVFETAVGRSVVVRPVVEPSRKWIGWRWAVGERNAGGQQGSRELRLTR